MKMKQLYLLIVIVMLSGFMGGAVSERLFSERTPAAQKMYESNIIAAEGFHLVDDDGTIRGAFSLGSDKEPNLHFLDKSGVFRASLSLGKNGIPSLHFSDSESNLRASFSLELKRTHLTFKGRFIFGLSRFFPCKILSGQSPFDSIINKPQPLNTPTMI